MGERNYMSGENVLGCASGVVGGAACVAVLPNTSGWMVVEFIGIAAIVIGGLGLLSAIVRSVAKRAYKA